MELYKSSILKLDLCDPKLKLLALEAIKESPFRFNITTGFRSIKEQGNLYAQGRTRPGKIITNCDGVTVKSKHNQIPAMAFDFAVFNENNELTWELDYYKQVGNHILITAKKLGINIKWPIKLSKNTYDWPHIQLA